MERTLAALHSEVYVSAVQVLKLVTAGLVRHIVLNDEDQLCRCVHAYGYVCACMCMY
jgi:hypothetical protein